MSSSFFFLGIRIIFLKLTVHDICQINWIFWGPVWCWLYINYIILYVTHSTVLMHRPPFPHKLCSMAQELRLCCLSAPDTSKCLISICWGMRMTHWYWNTYCILGEKAWGLEYADNLWNLQTPLYHSQLCNPECSMAPAPPPPHKSAVSNIYFLACHKEHTLICVGST